VFATLHGTLAVDNDPSTIDRLWNRFVAAWYQGGRDDPNLALLRLDAEHAHLWLNDSSFLAGVKLLMGIDPKKDYQKKTAEVSLE
jgi:general stress protein 26